MAGGLKALGRGILARWRVWFGVAISVFFLVWAGRQVTDFAAVGEALGRANYLLVLPALCVYFFGVWLRAARWRFLLRPLRPISPNRLFPVVVIGYMANDLLPARLGELVRAYVLGERESLSKSAVVATIAVERTFDGVAMLIFMGLVGAFVPLDERLQRVFQVAALVFAVALVAFVALTVSRERSLRLLDSAVSWLPSRLRSSLVGIAGKFVEGLGAVQSVRLAGVTLALSLSAWLAEAMMYYLIAIGFGLGLGPAAYVLTTAVANLGGMIPSSPGYVGVFEWFALSSLSLFGVSSNLAASYVLVLHVALLIPVSVLGLVYMWRLGLSLSALRATDMREEPRHS